MKRLLKITKDEKATLLMALRAQKAELDLDINDPNTLEDDEMIDRAKRLQDNYTVTQKIKALR